MKKNHLYLSLLCGIVVGILLPSFLQNPVHAESTPKLPPGGERKEDLLSSHQTEARYDGIQFIPCRFLTSLCPDRCGHAKNVAMFTILSYLDYQKTGEYGDEKQMVFSVDVSSPVSESSPENEIRKTIAELKEGDVVRLDWNHIYVTEKGNSFPERPVTRLERLDKQEK